MARQQQQLEEERKLEPLTGVVALNNNGNKIDLSTISSCQAMAEATSTVVGTQALTVVEIYDLSGSRQTANLLLEYIAQRITSGQLTGIGFRNWQGSVSEIQAQTLALIAGKAQALDGLYITDMTGASEAGKHALASYLA